MRGHSVAEKPLAEILIREVATGVLIALGVLAFLGIWLAFGDANLALGVGKDAPAEQ